MNDGNDAGMTTYHNGRRHSLHGRTRGTTTCRSRGERRYIGAFLVLVCLTAVPSGVAVATDRAQETRDPNDDRSDAAKAEMTLEPTSPNAPYSLANRTMTPSRPDAVSKGTDKPHLSDALAQRLWQSRLRVPDPNEDAETRAALDRMIRQIRSMRFARPEPEPAFAAPADVLPAEGADAEQVGPEVTDTSEVVTPIKQGPQQPGTPTPETRARINAVVKDPSLLNDPLEMAELLFLSGYSKEAAILYQKALERTEARGTEAAGDRAWILFQLGNCLRETDMIGAREAYLKVVAEHPDCPWVDLAKAHGRLISWYQKAKPHQLMAQTQP
jgi:hypothetical protein